MKSGALFSHLKKKTTKNKQTEIPDGISNGVCFSLLKFPEIDVIHLAFPALFGFRGWCAYHTLFFPLGTTVGALHKMVETVGNEGKIK